MKEVDRQEGIPESCLGCAAQGTCVFVDLPARARRDFEDMMQARSYPTGSAVVHQGEPVDGVFVVRSGVVRLLHLTRPGKAVAVHLVGPAGVLGLPEMVSEVPYPWTARVVEEAVLEFIPRARFLAFLAAYPEVALDLLGQVSQELVHLQRDLCATKAGAPMPERLLGKLRELCDGYGVATAAGLRLDLHMTVQDLADHLGCSRQWVSKALGDLEHRGMIRRESRDLFLTDAALAASLEAAESLG
jgi:CRP/FNR family cyclic AMP-dependent transcriptional regulator